MEEKLTGVSIAVLGGDARELILIPELLRLGAKVKVAGFPSCRELEEALLVISPAEAVQETEVVILPFPGTDAQGKIYAPLAKEELFLNAEVWEALSPGVVMIIGKARPFLRAMVQEYGIRLLEIAERDEVAILNAIPSAEGALQIALEELPITLHGSNAFVLGFGRLGQTLARVLRALGAKTWVVARKAGALARGYEQGYKVASFTKLPAVISQADVIFNTVPALVLDAFVLAKVRPEALIIDLASEPGGTDFEAAARLKRKAILASGLPGKVAPVTAGRILAQVVPALIRQELASREI